MGWSWRFFSHVFVWTWRSFPVGHHWPAWPLVHNLGPVKLVRVRSCAPWLFADLHRVTATSESSCSS